MLGAHIPAGGEAVHSRSEERGRVFYLLMCAPLALTEQEDTLLPFLTVRETLTINAHLRMPAEVKGEARNSIVEAILLELGLKDCANTIIGDSAKRGCSNSEKRRVSVAVQMLSLPLVIFLDEPTGLDSFSALTLVEMLESVAKRQKKTVVLSVHQPRSTAFERFDNIILLCRGGYLVYSGPQREILSFFDSLGFPCPKGVNPADFILDLASLDTTSETSEKESTARMAVLIEAWKKHTATPSPVHPAAAKTLKPHESARFADKEGVELESIPSTTSTDVPAPTATAAATPAHPEKPLLLRRSSTSNSLVAPRVSTLQHVNKFFLEVGTLYFSNMQNMIRDHMSILGVLGEAVFFAVLLGFVFWQTPRILLGVRSRLTLVQMAMNGQPYLLITVFLYMFSKDIAIFDADRAENAHGVVAWLVAHFLSYLPFTLFAPLVFVGILYPMSGMRAGFSSTFSPFWTYDAAALMANSLAAIPGFASGFIIQTSTLPIWLMWTKYISGSYWAFQVCVLTEFRDRKFPCPVPDPTNPICSAYDGNNIIYQVGFAPDYAITPRILVFLLIGIVETVISGILLRYVEFDTKLAGQATATPRKTPSTAQGGDAQNGTDVDLEQGRGRGLLETADRTDVRIENAKLTVVKRGPLAGSSREKVLLDGISTTFESGKLSAVLGTGSSGKTTLLNYVLRTPYPATAFQRCTKEGRVIYNQDVNPSLLALTSLAGFFRKDNEALYPLLTVRETLMYAAKLRLWNVSDHEKEDRVEEIIRVLGLKDCSNTQVGNTMIKGISGGEKRRLNIGLGMICNPKVLIIDEATTGLDSSAAQIVARTLYSIARSGRTVVVTSQQTRTEIFELFDSVLVLAGGGRVAYQGDRPGMLQFFEAAGHKCPDNDNPADYIIDVTSIDLRDAVAEKESRGRVDQIVATYSGLRSVSIPARDKSPDRFDVVMKTKEATFSGAPFSTAYMTLLRRGILNLRRRQYEFFDKIMLPGGIALIVVLFFSNRLQNDFFSIQNRLVGGERFFVFWFVSFAFLHAGESLALFILSIMDHIGLGIVVASVINSSLVAMCGVGAVNLPRVLDIINYISPLHWGIHALTVQEFTGLKFTCQPTPDQSLPDGTCIYQNGEQILDKVVNMSGERSWFNVVILLVLVILLRLLAFAGLKYKLRNFR
ncbi:P-loop containing nucleoside triphosphate hydrolase protein [Gonapodya prolifera JEL478]|uniref:p-loop containing nucleoside triphosphate hydrolase protein n=1 Tax=Gonapodya prolifera (strain JEL478) TaxID=1344416 RepID=A0A139A2K5_GONPJ|nr:P-loop containing nucleoside triphosphate hydrolase protein [Gonapodya prolifera JEL478]|eukprot:KXS10981.1 P-loop containing nucleoside triphosphate hydrolase protein [Gonapodya prolifera JEL478]